MTAEELSLVFCISEETIKKLAKTKQIPCLYTKNRIYFDFTTVLNHLKLLEESAA
jgi:hypothetical protein